MGAMSGTGYLNLGSSPMTLRFNGTAGDANAVFNFGTGTAAASLRNAPFGIALGGLTGGYGTALYGPSSYANQGTYTIGGAGVNTEFDGVIANGTDGATAVVKTPRIIMVTPMPMVHHSGVFCVSTEALILSVTEA